LFVPSSIYFFIYSICASIYAPPVLACMQLHRVNSSWVLIPALNILFYTGIYYLAACFIERFVPSLLVLILMVFLLFGQTFKPQIGDRSIAKSRYSRINILISYENYLVNKEIMK
ncbi:MAG: hypothetical protein JW774_05480, partial [Candidatus Aureabacteria bacterium]|nr:hypothetical protein [Candidatus Auribacterota bacterium]